jgi:hypothetical protein
VSATLLLIALGGMPCLPEELGYLAPRLSVETPPVSEAPVVPELPPAQAAAIIARVPASRPTEATQYRVMYGVFGDLGEIRISYAFPGDVVRAVGFGKGSLLGFGEMEKRLETQLDAQALSSRRWVTSRIQSGKTTVDTIEQSSPGSIEVVRRRTGRPDEGHRFVRKQPVLDPLGFLYQIRNRPPRTAQAYEVLDGRALWLIAFEPARAGTLDKGRAALMLRGQATPIFWDGQRDHERAARSFTLWLANDRYRTPLRLTMPLPVGEVRVDLAGIQREVATAPAASHPAVRPALAASTTK